MLRSAKTTVALLAGIFAVATVGVLAMPGAAEVGHKPGGHNEEKTLVAQSAYPFDVGDDRLLVGASENVFVGRVTKLENDVSSSNAPDPPPDAQSQFEVEVLENVKGRLPETLMLNQSGGYVEYSADRDYPENGVVKGERVRERILPEGSAPLEPGREYVFLTSYDRENGWHELVVSDHNIANVKVKGNRKALVERFEKAKQEQKDPAEVNARAREKVRLPLR